MNPTVWGATIWGALGRLINGTSGQTVLVRGTASSVGQAGMTYAKARGATVIATTRSADNATRLKTIGADAVVIDTGEIADQVSDVAPQEVDVALEVVGASTVRNTM